MAIWLLVLKVWGEVEVGRFDEDGTRLRTRLAWMTSRSRNLQPS
jgi:hypothetical protein